MPINISTQLYFNRHTKHLTGGSRVLPTLELHHQSLFDHFRKYHYYEIVSWPCESQSHCSTAFIAQVLYFAILIMILFLHYYIHHCFGVPATWLHNFLRPVRFIIKLSMYNIGLTNYRTERDFDLNLLCHFK